MKLFLLFIHSLLAFCVQAQVVKREIVQPDGNAIIHYEAKSSTSVDGRLEAKEFFWFDMSEIQKTMNGYRGNLLHGEATFFYKSGQLREQGRFVHGLKHGVWKKWNENGTLVQQEFWKSGLLHGTQEVYDQRGILVGRYSYKQGVLHGKTEDFSTDPPLVRKYKNGREQVKQEKLQKPEKKLKGDIMEMEEVDKEPDSDEKTKKKKKDDKTSKEKKSKK